VYRVLRASAAGTRGSLGLGIRVGGKRATQTAGTGQAGRLRIECASFLLGTLCLVLEAYGRVVGLRLCRYIVFVVVDNGECRNKDTVVVHCCHMSKR